MENFLSQNIVFNAIQLSLYLLQISAYIVKTWAVILVHYSLIKGTIPKNIDQKGELQRAFLEKKRMKIFKVHK